MSFLTKDNIREHCRTCLKRLSGSPGSTSNAINTEETPDSKDLYFNIYSDAELQQLISIYVDSPYKSEIRNSFNHDFPENICLTCFDKLHNFNVFRRRAQQSAEKLRTVLNCNSGTIKVEITYEEDEIDQHKEKPSASTVSHYKLEFKDALMENEEVFFETSAASLSDIEVNDNTIDPFSPSAQSVSECNSKEFEEKEEDSTKIDSLVAKKENFKCAQCNQSYTHNSELEAHVREMHNVVNKLPFACAHCDKSYRYIRSLQEHMKHKHQEVLNSNAPFKCSVCPKAFLTDLSLKKHMCFHIREDMARVCGICSKRFPVKNLLVEHLRTHSNDGRIPCGQCDKSFLWYQDLLNHETASHLKEKPFPCKLCDKSFQTQKSLRFHSYRHSGEKPYLCDVCGKDFRQPTAMKQHRLNHFKKDKNEKS